MEHSGRLSFPLHDAVEQEDLDRIREMLANGGDPNERDGAGMPLLHHAIDVEADSAIQQEMSMRSATTELLLQCGSDPKIEWKGMSALAFARQYGHARAVNLIEDALAERVTG